MQLVSETIEKWHFDRFPYVKIPVGAVEVECHESDDEVMIVWVMPAFGEIPLPMGHC